MTNEIGGIKLFETISFFYNYADVNFPKYCVYVDKGLFCRCEIMMLKCKLYKKKRLEDYLQSLFLYGISKIDSWNF